MILPLLHLAENLKWLIKPEDGFTHLPWAFSDLGRQFHCWHYCRAALWHSCTRWTPDTVWVSSFSRGPGWHLRKLSFLRTSVTPSWARTSHLSRLALALELNELQSGSTVQHHWVFESSLWKEDFLTWLFRTQQGWGKVTGNASGRIAVRGFLKKNGGKRAENENTFF